MLILNSHDVRQALPMAQAIEAMRRAFAAMARGSALVPPRIHMSIDRHEGVCLVMPAHLRDEGGESLTVKVVNLFAGNAKRGLKRIHAAVTVMDASTGVPIALLEGGALTAIRTGAAGGLATDLLARPDSRVVTMIGSGVQARTLLEAVCTVRRVEQVRVFSRSRRNVQSFIAEVAGHGPIPRDVVAADSAGEAARGTDILCTATTAGAPVIDDADIPAGAHLNLIGTYEYGKQEVEGRTVARCAVFVDDRAAAWHEAGDLIQPLRQGLIDESHVLADLGELVTGTKPGRTSEAQVTLFKSVGLAVQDAAAASAALANAAAMGLGQRVAW